ncbi:MAG: hypothetical protein M1825_003226 [Sarcosagium campestre]|nr:MAG: hypothetical protein M1825_003226 [Sarcosagium campestre]
MTTAGQSFAQIAALRGVASVYDPSGKESKQSDTQPVDSGAMVAALTAGYRSRLQSTRPSSDRDDIDRSSAATIAWAQRPKAQLVRNQSTSPSNIAASLAVSRSSSHRTVQSGRTNSSGSETRMAPPKPEKKKIAGGATSDPTDSTSIAPTSSLIGLFEQRKSADGMGSSSPLTAVGPLPTIRSPKPVRPLSHKSPIKTAATPVHTNLSVEPPSNRAAAPPEKRRASTQAGKITAGGNATSTKSAETARRRESVPARTSESPRASQRAEKQGTSRKASPPQPPPQRKPKGAPRASSEETTTQLSRTAPRAQLAQSTPSSPGNIKTNPLEVSNTGPAHTPPQNISSWANDLPASTGGERWTRPPTNKKKELLDEDSLANAMVASVLASTRLPPRQTPSTPPLPRRHSRGHLFPHHNHGSVENSRTPSPVKGMRQTMRKPSKSDDEVDPASAPYRKGRKKFIKTHPNKHHEGDRKRWRDAVTESERKRYEGVWAANKGLLLSSPSSSRDLSPVEVASGQVSNLVVRDIWSRSRLGDETLEEVWDLVDRRGIGALEREEFVVGMWLIDQRLKGRKLPIKVSDSVWESVRRLAGVKFR